MEPRERLKKLREKRGWTQQELADLMNVHNTTIQKLEGGKTDLTVAKMEKLAALFEVPVTEFFDNGSTKNRDKQGFLEPASRPYTPPKGHALASTANNKTLTTYQLTENILDEINLLAGDILTFDMSSEAVKNVKSGDVVLVQLYDPDNFLKAVTMIRQFIWPALLITNSAANNQPTINMRREDAHIKGIMTSLHKG